MAFGTGITFDGTEVKELTNIAWDIGTVDDVDITNHDKLSPTLQRSSCRELSE